MDDEKEESGSGEPGAEMNKPAETPVEGENAEIATMNAEGDSEKKSTEEPGLETKLESSTGEDLPKTDDEVRIGELLKERGELLEKIEELTRGEGEGIAPPNAVLMAEVEVTSIEHNGATGDKHGYTVRVKPTPGAYHHPYEFSLGMITSHGAKNLVIGKKYHIAVNEA